MDNANFVLAYVWFHPWAVLADHKNWHPAEPTHVEINKMHTFQTSTSYLSPSCILWTTPIMVDRIDSQRFHDLILVTRKYIIPW